MREIRLHAIVAAAFMAGAFLASPELRAYAANTVGSVDIINNSIQSVDIKDGEVKTADIATGAVAAGRIADGAVGTLKIADNSIAAVDIAPDAVGASEIATSAVGAAEIAANAVGASEIAGVSNPVFAECTRTSNINNIPGSGPLLFCDVAGVGPGDVAIATVNQNAGSCFVITKTNVVTNQVTVLLLNSCPVNAIFGTATIAIIVFDTAGVIIP